MINIARWVERLPRLGVFQFVLARVERARKEADRLACEAWNERMLGFQDPKQGLPDTKVGTLTQALYDEAKKKNWTVIGMKNDWKKIFSFE
ncbi:hypothetical protein [Bradyrhizobium sp. 27S5]|uniref:hypothetical protein n=1 Tax=Bradyrhizobium sp. 27S5 TaxID=3139728 RepID=UPI0030CD6AF9